MTLIRFSGGSMLDHIGWATPDAPSGCARLGRADRRDAVPDGRAGAGSVVLGRTAAYMMNTMAGGLVGNPTSEKLLTAVYEAA
jgi:hypothetical protein